MCLFMTGFISCVPDEENSASDIRSQLTGTWQCEEHSESYEPNPYNVEISADATSSSGIFITNFFSLGSSVIASAAVIGSDVTIPVQILPGGFKISGSGFVSEGNSRIDLQYTVQETPAVINAKTGSTESVTAVYTKNN